MKPAMALRAVRAVTVPDYAQRLGAERASGRPFRTAFRTLLEKLLCAAQRLSDFLQIEKETARGITTD
jgi:hypothetical protein